MKRPSLACLLAALAAILLVPARSATAEEPTTAPAISVDAAQRGQPISKYIYGQFIEHLGRCIYGGIWAEMLEDRKFFYPVGHKESPWKPIGGKDAVRMSTEEPFVGAHTPEIIGNGADERGISQSGLGLVAGKKYVGRLWLKGSAAAGPVTINLVWGDGPGDRQGVIRLLVETTDASRRGPGPDSRPYLLHAPLEFTAGKSTNDGRLEIVAKCKGNVRVGTVSLMPADNVQDMRADTLKLLAELDAPVYRWPGGNFVSGYDWRDGIGQRDRRPPRKNPAWKGVEHNDFGIHEFMAFCRYLKTEPYIAVNSGAGDVQSARDQLEYVNGGADTPLGRLRAANGHPEPYGVKFWGIGNEMYGNWQIGHMPLEKYVEKHNQFAKAMRAADPSIKLVAVGAAGRWSETMMARCADQMDLISEHFYCQEKPGLWEHTQLLVHGFRPIVAAHRDYRKRLDSLKGKDIRIALDEWNYWYGPEVFGEGGVRYNLRDGLGTAAGLHEMFRHSDLVFMANYAQTVNVLACIKTSKTQAAFESTGLVLKLYRRQFGTVPLATQTAKPLDAMAALSADGKTLTLGVVNASLEPLAVPLKLAGLKLAGSGTRWQIAGSDPKAFNDPDTAPERIKIEESSVSGVGDMLALAPCSVTLLALKLE